MATRSEKQLAKRFRIIDDAETALTAGIKNTEKSLFDDIIKYLGLFDTSGGKLKYNTEAAKQINIIAERIFKAVNSSEYRTKVNDYLKTFDDIKDQNIKIQSSINKINVSRSGLTNLQTGVQKQTVNALLGSGLDVNFIEPVKKVIFDSVVSGKTITEAEETLRQIILGDSQRLGHLERYVKQIARDSISQYDGMIQARLAAEFELDGVSYEGSIIRDSRPQCVRWAGQGVLKVSELAEEINWAFSNGSGMIPQTTPETFTVFRGGYNCRHFATAIRLTD